MAYEFQDLTEAERKELDQLDAEIDYLRRTRTVTEADRADAVNEENAKYQEDLGKITAEYQAKLDAIDAAVSQRMNDRSHIAKPKE
jgi:hypothetical protein